MKSFTQSLKRQDGFTLVELMVVVAIIGLLSAVAIPNFKKYQAKAKMSEAKLQLSAVYTAQASFFSDFNIHAACLNYMGYDPSLEAPSRYYAVGFQTTATINATAWTSAQNSGLQSGTGAGQCSSSLAGGVTADAGGISFYPAGKGAGASVANAVNYLANTMLGTQATSSSATADATGITYVIGAAGVIDGNFGANTTSSLLTIDNNKLISIRRNGF
jgi:type IV pilus assembly protein PilA